jgi:hypothetical protein
MHYLIFIPHKHAANRQHLIDAGLADLVRPDDEQPLCNDLVGPGPGDLPGQIWSWGEGIPAYLPERQTWTKDPLGRYWLGITNGDPPKPTELVRKRPVEGLGTVLGDGQEWVIPNVVRLPTVFDLDAQAKPIRVPHPRYKAFVDECGWAFQSVVDVLLKTAEPEWQRSLDFVVMALGINYRLTKEIAIRLGFLDESVLHTLMAKATDAPRIRELIDELKKKAAASTLSG